MLPVSPEVVKPLITWLPAWAFLSGVEPGAQEDGLNCQQVTSSSLITCALGESSTRHVVGSFFALSPLGIWGVRGTLQGKEALASSQVQPCSLT